jgi:predicted ABC-type transport system involved in lysophospholipase L1 biosynthesis ATPase subunit
MLLISITKSILYPSFWSIDYLPFLNISCTIHVSLEEGEEASTDEAPPSILRDCNLVITRGMRIVVRGPNGAGNNTTYCLKSVLNLIEICMI